MFPCFHTKKCVNLNFDRSHVRNCVQFKLTIEYVDQKAKHVAAIAKDA